MPTHQTGYDTTFYADIHAKSVASSKIILSLLKEQLGTASILDLGAGLCPWGQSALELGISYLGVDGDYVDASKLSVPRQHFLARDLTVPFATDQRFDLAICMEVGEHLPERSATVLVESLVHHADIVLFSAAIPWQGGTHHINERWPSWWATIFEQKGFLPIDLIRPQVWSNEQVAEYYAQNAILYAKTGEPYNRVLMKTLDVNARNPILDIVHPREYTRKADLARRSVGEIIQSLPAVASRVIRNLIHKAPAPTQRELEA
jgi:hypothetical protein